MSRRLYVALSVLTWSVACQPGSAVDPNQAPTADLAGPYRGIEGTAITFDARGSSDPDGDRLSYVWQFEDSASATGPLVDYSYAENGLYTARLIVTDSHGLADTAHVAVTVDNAPPRIISATLTNQVMVATVTATFHDPGTVDVVTATVDWGDGNTSPIVAGNASHAYHWLSSRRVILKVQDDDGAVTQRVLWADANP